MRKLLKGLLWVVGIVAVAAVILRLTALRAWQVPNSDPLLSASITPTIRPGEWLLLWRGSAPMTGDLVLCPEPSGRGFVIGRIAAEAGDTIEFDYGYRLKINGRRTSIETSCVPPTFVTTHPTSESEIVQECDIEGMGNTRHEIGATARNFEPLSRSYKKTVEPDRVFLVSDNRVFPYDSRRFGTVLRKTCTERVVFRVTGAKGLGDSSRRFTYIP